MVSRIDDLLSRSADRAKGVLSLCSCPRSPPDPTRPRRCPYPPPALIVCRTAAPGLFFFPVSLTVSAVVAAVYVLTVDPVRRATPIEAQRWHIAAARRVRPWIVPAPFAAGLLAASYAAVLSNFTEIQTASTPTNVFRTQYLTASALIVIVVRALLWIFRIPD